MVALDKKRLRREIEKARRTQFKARLLELRELMAQLLAEQERTERELRRSSVAGVPF